MQYRFAVMDSSPCTNLSVLPEIQTEVLVSDRQVVPIRYQLACMEERRVLRAITDIQEAKKGAFFTLTSKGGGGGLNVSTVLSS